MTIDVGCSVVPLLDPERIMAPALLAFADVRPATIPAAALEQHLAEKLHAYTRRYAGNRPSSRVKDLIDIALISEIASFQAQRVDDAIERLFAARATHQVPETLPSPPASWVSPYADLAREVGLDRSLAATAAATAGFLDPVLASTAAGRWDPSRRTWERTSSQ